MKSSSSSIATPEQHTKEKESKHSHKDDAISPISLIVNVPAPGVNNCANPFVASGSVQPTNLNMAAHIVTPTGNMQGTVTVGANPANPNGWTCTFANNPPPNVSLSFVITASDSSGLSRQVAVAFSCGPVQVNG